MNSPFIMLCSVLSAIRIKVTLLALKGSIDSFFFAASWMEISAICNFTQSK